MERTTADELIPEREQLARIISLGKTPAWSEMRARYDALLQEACVMQGRLALLSPTVEDQRVIDFKRGFWAGVRAILDYPAAAEKQLERLLEKEGEQS